jgi:uncharacterized membrane protein HdeD (DUF308 family)
MLKSLSTSLILRGILALTVGTMALAWPGPTVLVLVLIVASWAVIAGLVEASAASGASAPAGTRALFILGGLGSVAFGMVLFARPGVGAITLALLFGLFNLAYGARALMQGIELLGSIRNAVHSAVPEPMAAHTTSGHRQHSAAAWPLRGTSLW